MDSLYLKDACGVLKDVASVAYFLYIYSKTLWKYSSWSNNLWLESNSISKRKVVKIRGMEYLSHEVRLREQGQFSLKKKPPRDLTVAFQYLKRS